MDTTITAHFVTFYSPGTFVAEETTLPVDAWSVQGALAVADTITERYGAKPYGFRFTTRTRGPNDLDSKVTERSPMHYFGVRIDTLAGIKARDNPDDRILISNMECNGWDRVVTTTSGWKCTRPLEKGDVVLNEEGKAVV